MSEYATIGSASAHHVLLPRLIRAGASKMMMDDLSAFDLDAEGEFPTGARAVIGHWRPAPSVGGAGACEAAISALSSHSGGHTGNLLQYTCWRYDYPSYIDNLWHLTQARSGLVGVSDFDLPHLRLVVGSGIDIASNRISASVLDRRFEHLIPWCSENGVVLLGYGATLGGLVDESWVGKPEPTDAELGQLAHGRSEDDDPRKWKRYVDAAGGWAAFQSVLATLETIARKHGAPIASVAVRYVLDAGVIAVFLDQDCPAGEVALDDGDRAAIATAQSKLTPLPGGCGDELRFPPFLTSSGSRPPQAATAWETPQRRAEIERVVAAAGRVEYMSGSPWEPVVGYCRSVRYKDRIVVSGTTTRAHPSRRGVVGADAEDQATFVFDIIRGAIVALGGSMADIVRTRILYADVARDWLAVGRVQQREIMGRHGVLPANTMVGGLTYVVGANALLEIEAETVMGAGVGEVLRLDPRQL